MTLIAFAQREDRHTTLVLERISREYGINSLIVDQWNLDKLFFQSDCKHSNLYLSGQKIDLGKCLMWWRVKYHFGRIVEKTIPDFSSFQEQIFFREQWKAVQSALEFSSSDAIMMNNFMGRHLSNNKLLQLCVARNLGFSVPETVIGNDTAGLEFVGSEVFFKSLTPDFIDPETPPLTAIYDKSELLGMKDEVAGCPSIYQTKLPKKYELRVCVFLEDVYAFKIDTNYHEKYEQDWRLHDLSSKMLSYIELSSDLNSKLVKMLKVLGLYYGIFDIVVTPDGEEVFLEVNMDGQWLWIQDIIDFDLVGKFSSMVNKVYSERLKRSPSILQM